MVNNSPYLPTVPANRFERVPILVTEGAVEASRLVAAEIAALIHARDAENLPTVLGLATGSTPLGIYRELIRLHRKEGLSFRNVITFNLDEYFSLRADAPESYHHFMQEQLFSHIDIQQKNIHLPDGSISREKVGEFCNEYENRIRVAGGLDILLLGIGRTGHIGFNEPGSTQRSRTRIITLDYLTRRDNSSYFSKPEEVPVQAITMGIGTILDARRILLLAFGEHKADIVSKAFEAEPQSEIPASYLQLHNNTLVLLDQAAASYLTRIRYPWLTGPLEDLHLKWDDAMIKKAVTWLAQEIPKPVLKLTDLDYNEHGLQELLGVYGSAYEINLKVFRSLQSTITGWPAGRPEKTHGPRRILIFSPHPDDDVLSMGGTLIRMAQQGHEVHIAYQVSGSQAVSDRTLQKFSMFAEGLGKQTGRIVQHVLEPSDNRRLKGLIRRLEATHAADVCGIPQDRLHFLNMPFDDLDRNQRHPLGHEDIELMRGVLEKVRPHQIYAAGDLSDPHGTHRLCLEALEKALRLSADSPWMPDCEVWLYRGAWMSWEIYEVEMAVPISPGELLHKRRAIFQHETQKDQAVFLGNDGRDFWQRAEERTRAAATLFNEIGMVEYEAIETFARMSSTNLISAP